MTASIAGSSASKDVQDFLAVFLPLAWTSSDSKTLRQEQWKKADTIGNSQLSLTECERWIQSTLIAKYQKTRGMVVYKHSFPSIMRAFQSSRNVPGAASSDAVNESEFRLFLAYLCVYALAADAFQIVDDTVTAKKSDHRDLRLSKDEWLNGCLKCYNHGFLALAGAVGSTVSKGTLEATFDRIDNNKNGSISLTEWCNYLAQTEQAAGTIMGSLLRPDPSSTVEEADAVVAKAALLAAEQAKKAAKEAEAEAKAAAQAAEAEAKKAEEEAKATAKAAEEAKAKKAAEASKAKVKADEELKAKLAEEEAKAAAKKAEEDAKRAAQEAEASAKAAEEAKAKTAAEEVKAKAKAEEEAKAKKAEQEAKVAVKKAEEDAKRAAQEAETTAKAEAAADAKKAQDEAKAAARAEEQTRAKKLEEEARALAKEAEDKAKKAAEESQAATKLAEAAKAKKAAEEAAAKKKAEEEAKALKAAQEAAVKKQAEEEKAKKAAEEAEAKAKKAPEEAKAEKKATEEKAKKPTEEADGKRKAAEAEAKKLAGEAEAKKEVDEAKAKKASEDVEEETKKLITEAEDKAKKDSPKKTRSGFFGRPKRASKADSKTSPEKKDKKSSPEKKESSGTSAESKAVRQIPLTSENKVRKPPPSKTPEEKSREVFVLPEKSSPEKSSSTKAAESHAGTDPALSLVLFAEEAPANPATQVLTSGALEHIVKHKYVSGTYTWLDNLCNPMWTTLTEYLPINMAPNLVTLCGALHCLASYIWTWIAQPTAIEAVPPSLLVANSYCLFVAYTLDCMDGKQARRTRTSSPLGQLLDHGLDCLCLLAHVAAVQAWLRAGDTLQLQMILQLSFYVAQWEEFYTGILPHATGPIGVTEVNYALALVSFVHGVTGASADPAQNLYDVYILDDVQGWLHQGWLSWRLVDVVLGVFFPTERSSSMGKLTRLLEGIQRKDVILFWWCTTMSFLCVLSLVRVYRHLKTIRHRLTAFLQLTTPVALVGLALMNEFAADYYDGNANAIRTTIRWKSLAIGLLFCHVTIKVIVYSMARQAVAAVQWDALPLVGAIVVTVFDPRLHYDGHVLVWQVLSAFWGWRLLSWSSTAVQQICDRLGIAVWTIPKLSMGEC